MARLGRGHHPQAPPTSPLSQEPPASVSSALSQTGVSRTWAPAPTGFSQSQSGHGGDHKGSSCDLDPRGQLSPRLVTPIPALSSPQELPRCHIQGPPRAPGLPRAHRETAGQCQCRDLDPGTATTSAPNHSWPARLSCRISSGNLTQKSLGARSWGMHTSMIWLMMFKTLS